MYQAGTTLKLDFGTFCHFGIADGEGNVIHNSKRRMMVTHDTEAEFSEGREILVSSITSENQGSAVLRAMSYIGMPYNLMSSNCEHFARLAHGIEIESTQLQQYLLAACGIGIAVKNNNTTVKLAGGAAAMASLLTPTEESPFKNSTIAVIVVVALMTLAKS